MTISFDAIPIDLRTPGQYIEYSNRRASRGVTGIPSLIVLFAQKLSTGTAAPLVPILVSDATDAEGLGGRGSQLHRMVRALRAVNTTTELRVVALDDAAAGVRAAGAYTFGGTVAAAGTLSMLIGGQRVRVAVAAAEASSVTATAVAAAINAVTDLPVTAVVNGTNPAKVDVTARHKGECGNTIDLRHSYYDGEALPLGMTVTVTAMTGGTGNPDIAPALAALGDTWYSDFVTPYTDTASLAAMRAELDDRWGPLRQQDGFAWTAYRGTYAQMSTYGAARNDKLLQVLGCGLSPTTPDEVAAIFGGVCAYELKNAPGRQLQTVRLTGMLAPSPTDRLDRAKRNLLLCDGISTHRVDADGNCILDRVITTYQKNAFNIDDVSYLDTTRMRCLAVGRYQMRARMSQVYARAYLAADGTVPTAAVQDAVVATPNGIMGTAVAAYAELIDALVFTDMATFKAESRVELDGADRNRANAKFAMTDIAGLIVFAAQIEFRG